MKFQNFKSSQHPNGYEENLPFCVFSEAGMISAAIDCLMIAKPTLSYYIRCLREAV